MIINIDRIYRYQNSTSNDLLYWGLDYPPLTAYVSYAFGLVAHRILPELVELYGIFPCLFFISYRFVLFREVSRGYETPEGKTFMRATVLLCDLIILIPAFFSATIHFMKGRGSDTSQYTALVTACCLAPPLILIDNGHFQYNGVCIGLAILAVDAILSDKYVIGSILFCLSLNFKQMALYYSPVFFFVLLRKCFERQDSLARISTFATIGVTVVLSFAVMWFPFCLFPMKTQTCGASLLQVLHRLFPFSRGFVLQHLMILHPVNTFQCIYTSF